MTYYTYDYLPDLSLAAMQSARTLTLVKETDPSLSRWENAALFASTENYAILHDTFVFSGVKGATYDVVSSSFFDPFILEVYDNKGNVIAVDDGQMAYGYDHTSFIAPYTGLYYFSASWYQGSSSSNKAVAAGVFEDLDTVPGMKKNIIAGSDGNDRILGTEDSDDVNGGAGTDTFVLGRQRAHYSVIVKDGVVTVTDTDGLSGTDTLQNVERIQFFDEIMSFETSGIPAQAYRLYQAAFNRAPDAAGLGYWVGQLNHGATMQSVATAFVGSNEFRSMFGTTPTNSQVLLGVYQNVLHRPPDQSGFDFWLGLLNNKSITVVDMLLSFSESPENQAQVIGSLHAGYEYTF
ncbi:DUF4214 domain-containing protein [Massilia agilis]|uniref:DUF4214 domain-containing protein n=1 Tax=Massilia agilis TaxID=1811226 RepID=A0ABT2DE05_9BURK|nr:DUF4214 domain-containing protein [Massilia agilis]MCS0808656.1 DUF4214 domain-containing protein [Massilia agilis]